MDNNAAATVPEFDLMPSPRVLAMLGEISLDQWRCVAELIDNSVDGFLNASREGTDLANRRVDVSLPQTDKDGAQVRVIDTGIGMTPEVLESAVRAGYSGNNTLDNLGLFGMGFNIATARLGSITEVWTTRAGDLEWHGLVIDFNQMRSQRHFRTAHLTRPKADPAMHGTEITIKQLKPDQRKWLAKSGNHTSVRRLLAQSYSSMLRPEGIPISFELFVNNIPVQAWKHCTWNEDRVVSTPDGDIRAVMPFNYEQPARPYCTYCMNWLSEQPLDHRCPICEQQGSVAMRSRRVRGWLGLQRYLDETKFGIDFIRNGRKIELRNKDLFTWKDSESEEREYPIDDQRHRGRIVGEVHIDHCRVTYAKDHFERSDPFWNEMVTLLRGEGPLRPQEAKSLGFGPNDSILFRLFKSFRRSSPHAKTAGAYERLMVVKNNDRAAEMATFFHEGHPDYQDDGKWWELVQEAERELLYGPTGSPPAPMPNPIQIPGGGTGLPPGLLGGSTSANPATPSQVVVPLPPLRRAVPSLTRRYTVQEFGWNVQAFEVQPNDPELPIGAPWAMPIIEMATKTYGFLFNPKHDVFRSVTMTPRDAVLIQLSWMTAELSRSSKNIPDIPKLLADLRNHYGDENLLDTRTMATEAGQVLNDLARALVANCPQDERAALFNELVTTESQQVMLALATKKVKPAEVIADGTFLYYAPHEVLRGMIDRHPELCFDGKIWDEAYEGLDYHDAVLTENVKAGIRAKFLGLINDAIFLARQDANDLASSTREELVRATMSLHMLRPDTEIA